MQNYLSILLNGILVRHEKMWKAYGCFTVVTGESFPACVHHVVLHGSERCGELTWKPAGCTHSTFRDPSASWSFPVPVSQLLFPTCPVPRNINIRNKVRKKARHSSSWCEPSPHPSRALTAFTLSPDFLGMRLLSRKVLSQWISNYMPWTSDRHMPSGNCKW